MRKSRKRPRPVAGSIRTLSRIRQCGADEAVEVASGHQSVLLLGGLPSKLDHVVAIGTGVGELEPAAESLGQRRGPTRTNFQPRSSITTSRRVAFTVTFVNLPPGS